MFIGKSLKTWVRLAFLSDPEPDQFEQKGKAIIRRGRWSKRTLSFIGSLKPLLVAHRQKRRRRRSALLDANVDNPGNNGEEVEDADADGGTRTAYGQEST